MVQSLSVKEKKSLKSIDTVMVLSADSLDQTLDEIKQGLDLNINTNALLKSLSRITDLIPADLYKKRLEIEDSLMKKALANRGINLPYELGYYDLDGKYSMGTTSRDSFLALPVKVTSSMVSMNDASLMSGDGAETHVSIEIFDKKLFVGFQHTGSHAFRRMSGMLALSAILILVHICAFILMVRMFIRQKRLGEIRSSFMSNMTHELKTPISSVSLALDLLQAREQEKGSVSPYIGAAQSELGRLTSMVSWVLDMSAFEERKIQLSYSHQSLGELVQQITASLMPVLDQRNARIDTAITPPDLQADIDPIHFGNVIRNLADNAIKYNKQVQPVVTISVSEMPAGSIVITVADNGIGISEKYQRQVFEQFFRVPTGDVHDVKGFGLGLSYVKTIVGLHHGQISLQSEPGKGTTFTIRIPKNRKA
jgi:two-component system phosphate regulon sensor histidine kinase PhoR